MPPVPARRLGAKSDQSSFRRGSTGGDQVLTKAILVGSRP